jgi:Uncharacterized protein encoded in toxicity protection region of plasmid R478, contains von Willebrand factor (vWF) domain
MNEDELFYSLDFGSYDLSEIKVSRKIPICLVLDCSGSMCGDKINELNQNINKFLSYVKKNEKAKRICDLCIITFGGDGVQIIHDYDSVDNIDFNNLEAYGQTPLGAAVLKAQELLDARGNITMIIV